MKWAPLSPSMLRSKKEEAPLCVSLEHSTLNIEGAQASKITVSGSRSEARRCAKRAGVPS